MSSTSVQNESAVRFGSGVLKIGGVNVGMIKDAKCNIQFLIGQVKGHNARLRPRKKIESAKLTAVLYEIDLSVLNSIDSHGVLTNTLASPVNVTGEVVKSGGWVVGTPLKLANKNGANTVVSSIVIKAGTTYGGASTLTLNTDYRVYVGNGVNGTLGHTYIVPLTSQSNNIYGDYTYTPNASKRITWSDVAKLITTYESSFENSDENGKKFGITLPESYSSQNFELAFASDDEIDKTAELPIELTAYPDDQNRVIYMDDEQAVD